MSNSHGEENASAAEVQSSNNTDNSSHIDFDDTNGGGAKNKPVDLPEKIDRYVIESELGTGGMGVVYRAHDPFLNETVAVKVLISTQFNQSHLVRFQKEAKAISQLKHPGFVKVFTFGIDGATPFIVLEYLKGESLRRFLKHHGAFDSIDALSIAGQVALSMSHAHKHSVIHRDLKPANMLLVDSEIGDKRVVKIIDFGVAVLMNQQVTGRFDSGVIGTPAYMSPEQIKNNGLDERSDIYALGCVLYELLTGRQVFAGETALEVMRRQVEDPLPELDLPTKLDSNLQKEIEAVVARALDKNPDERFQTMIEFNDAINRVIEHIIESQKETGVDNVAPSIYAIPGLTEKTFFQKAALPAVSLVLFLGVMAAIVFLNQYSCQKQEEQTITIIEPAVLDKFGTIGDPDIATRSDEWLEQNMPTMGLRAKLSHSGVTDKGLKLLTKKRFFQLYVADLAQLSDDGLEAISKLRDLTTLDISTNREFSEKGLAYLRRLPYLTELSVQSANLTPAEFDEIGKLESLSSLSIGGNNRINETGLKFLQNLKYLQILDLPKADINVEYFKTLRGIPHLWRLNVAKNSLHDKDVKKIVETLPTITFLNIDDNPVTDKALEYATTSPTLQYIVNFQSKFSDEAKEKFNQSMPGRLVITSDELQRNKEIDDLINKPKTHNRFLPNTVRLHNLQKRDMNSP